jgi:signal transduction histidine kinase
MMPMQTDGALDVSRGSKEKRRNRKRLRTRIIWSVLLIGTLLSVLFAAFALFLRANLEERIIDRVLLSEVERYAKNFEPGIELEPFSKIAGKIVSDAKYANINEAWKNLPPGVHRIQEREGDVIGTFKLAVYRLDGKWFFLRYDVTAEERTRRVVTLAIVFSVLAFSLLALVLGIYSSSRIMSPVADLSKRVLRLSKKGKVEALASHFADDEVGTLASAFDDYALRLTELVERDREFNSDVSHELRTPLAVIRSTTELLMSMPDIPKKAAERLNRIDRAAKQSTELIAALLHLSRAEKQGPADGESTAVEQIIQQIVDSNRHHLIGRPVSVIVEANEALHVAAPESVLAVVLGNLIGNAFKYTKEGTVQIRVNHNSVAVADSGPGIPDEERDKVFDRHFRGESGKAGGSGSGAGLGLAIVRRLCALYGWNVELKPREPHGLVALLDFSGDEAQKTLNNVDPSS